MAGSGARACVPLAQEPTAARHAWQLTRGHRQAAHHHRSGARDVLRGGAVPLCHQPQGHSTWPTVQHAPSATRQRVHHTSALQQTQAAPAPAGPHRHVGVPLRAECREQRPDRSVVAAIGVAVGPQAEEAWRRRAGPGSGPHRRRAAGRGPAHCRQRRGPTAGPALHPSSQHAAVL